MVELLSPAGDWISLRAAAEAGCDAVYFGVKSLNMRASAKNFSVSELPKITKFCQNKKIKAYLVVNTIIYEKELNKVRKILAKAKKSEVDAVICWDMSVVKLAKKIGLDVHLSTQASVSNSEAAKFYKNAGVKRIILARECSLKDIKDIRKNAGVEIEVFVHGAMCVSLSGRCFLSQEIFQKSANRGECLQPCRRKYLVKDVEEGHCLELGQDYIMSPKDLCALPFLDKILKTKVDALKIEGRTRSPEYVKVTTECYRQSINSISAKKFSKQLVKKLMKKLSTVYNRGFSSGFFRGLPTNDDFAHVYGNKAERKKVYIGKVEKELKGINKSLK